jgi:pilus assembly protein CpaB
MNRNRLLIGLALAIVLAFILSAFVYRQFKAVASRQPVIQMQHIVVAAGPLPLGTRLDQAKLRTIPWPGGVPVRGMFTRVQDVTNRALITDVAENEPILDSKLAPIEAGAGLSATIPEGMRAMSVAVNDVVGVAGFVTPGTMVDIMVTGALSESGGHGNSGSGGNITRTILENVRVLAAGQKVEQSVDGKPQNVPVITLLVTPEDASKLAMASTEGKIQLALRNTIDTGVTNPPAVLQTSLFAPSAPPPSSHPAVARKTPAPTPASPYVVEVITGSKHETKEFPAQ